MQDPSGSEEPQQDPPAAKSRAQARARTGRPLPTDRLKLDSQKDVLRAIALGSNRGTQPVTSKDIAVRLHIVETTAGLNNNFFLDVGLITRSRRGAYLPVPAVLEFNRLWSFDEADAGRVLADVLRESWCFKEVDQQTQMGRTSVPAMIKVLAQAADADAGREQQLMMVLEWLAYAQLIELVDGYVFVRDANAPVTPEDEQHQDKPTAPVPEPTTVRSHEPQADRTRARPVPVLTLNFDFALTAEELGQLSPEQIKAVFEAVGSVASIKAALLT